MKKNVASQVIGAQMVSATDGSAFTGSVTCYVTGDGGTQAAGSVGSGACTHEGNGFHTYAPAQSETNYDHIAFTFTGTGAVPATVQVYTTFPQTGDSFARIGATGSGLTSLATQASVDTVDDFLDTEVAAILAAVDTEVAAIKAKTDNLPASPAATGDIPSAATIADAVWDEALAGHAGAGSAGAALSAAGSAGDPWSTALPGAYGAGTAGKIIGDNLNATVSSRASQTSLDTVDDFLDTEIAAIKAKTDNLPAAPAATGDIPTTAEIADKILGRNLAGGADGTRTVTDALRALRNKVAVSGGTMTVYQEDDSTSAWTASVTTAAGDPISAIDPA